MSASTFFNKPKVDSSAVLGGSKHAPHGVEVYTHAVDQLKGGVQRVIDNAKNPETLSDNQRALDVLNDLSEKMSPKVQQTEAPTKSA